MSRKDEIINKGLDFGKKLEAYPNLITPNGEKYCELIRTEIRKSDNECIKEYKLSSGQYLYECYEENEEKPYEIYLGSSRIDDLDKQTSFNEFPLTYPSASATIGQNMRGVFYDYDTGVRYDGQFHSLGIYVRSADETKSRIESEVSSYDYYEQRPVELFSIQFHDKKIHAVAAAQQYIDDKSRVAYKVALTSIDENGNLDFKELEESERYFAQINTSLAEKNNSPYRDYWKSIDNSDKNTSKAVKTGINIFAPLLSNFGVSIPRELLIEDLSKEFIEIVNGNVKQEFINKISGVENISALQDVKSIPRI